MNRLARLLISDPNRWTQSLVLTRLTAQKNGNYLLLWTSCPERIIQDLFDYTSIIHQVSQSYFKYDRLLINLDLLLPNE